MIRPDLAYRFPNTGVRWSSVEIELLRTLAEEGVDWREIGIKFGRTSEACRTKAAEQGIIETNAASNRRPVKRQRSSCVLSL